MGTINSRSTCKPVVLAIIILLLSGGSIYPNGLPERSDIILVEAEAFENYGGWANDQQFMDEMGSPFLLAHGVGRPVEDATTTVSLSRSGKYRIWVRTRDWVGQWNAPSSPGIFKVLINGKELEPVFGSEGTPWHWQDGGIVDISGKEAKITLHDLTGFEGRCDAIIFCLNPDYKPDNNISQSERQRLLNLPQEPEFAGRYDFVVVGGGLAGLCAAINAGNLGLRVALVHNRPILGGNNSGEVHVGVSGDMCLEPYPLIGILTKNVGIGSGTNLKNAEKAERYRKQMLLDAGVDLFVNSHVNEVITDGKGRITGVVSVDIVNSKRRLYTGKYFADCTGDGTVGFLAGADWDMSHTRMGRTNYWRFVDYGEPTSFPVIDWGIDLSDIPFPGRHGKYQHPRFDQMGGWFWESGFFYDPFKYGEHIRDNNLRAMYSAVNTVKNIDKDPVYENYGINKNASHLAGMRESRRLMGDVVLTVGDIRSGKKFVDGCVPITWRIDVHYPDPTVYVAFLKRDEYKEMSKRTDNFDDFISIAPRGEHTKYPKPFWLPYRTLYSRNISNLFMAGRDISVTEYALGAVRVQSETGMMGEIVGMAVFLANRYDTTPRGVYEKHLSELNELMKKGVIPALGHQTVK